MPGWTSYDTIFALFAATIEPNAAADVTPIANVAQAVYTVDSPSLTLVSEKPA